jgi:hypothetical protein
VGEKKNSAYLRSSLYLFGSQIFLLSEAIFLSVARLVCIPGIVMDRKKVAEAFGALFDGPPDVSVWGESDWASF